jgi:hypothetical protein
MEALVLCELLVGATGAREALLARIGRLGLAGRARLSFVGRQETSFGAVTMIAAGFVALAEAEHFVVGCADDGIRPGAVRLLQLEPVWQAEPLPLMFP